MRRLACICGLALSLVADAHAAPSAELKIAIVKPGAGFLVADGSSTVPLEMIVDNKGSAKIQSATVTASEGKVMEARVIDGERVWFLYTPPKRNAKVSESLEISLVFPDGERAETFPFDIPAPKPPEVDLLVEPATLEYGARRKKKEISVNATATGKELSGIEVSASPGKLGAVSVRRIDEALRASATYAVKQLPDTAPSYVLAIAATASPRGYAARTGGVAVDAPVKVSVDIPDESELTVEGALNNPEPVEAAVDGPTEMDNIIVRYGSDVRFFARRGLRKTEVAASVPVNPTPGLVVPIPGQNVADGGSGPTVLVAVAPSALGEVVWPEIQVEGAEVLARVKIANDLRALVLKRPREPGNVTVLLDGIVAATIPFGSKHGTSIEIAPTAVKAGERAAAEVVVRDQAGTPTDLPTPQVRAADGTELPLTRVSEGTWRASLESSSGARGQEIEVLAEIPPPPLVAGEPLASAQATTRLSLGAVTAAKPDVEKELVLPELPVKQSGTRVGFGPLLGLGTTFSSLFEFTIGGILDVRPPVFDNRLSLRLGILYVRATGSGSVQFAEANAARTIIAGVHIPFDVGVALLSSDAFELLIRAGAAVRFDRGVLEVDGETALGGDKVGFGGHVALEGGITLGKGAVVLSGAVTGIGARADGIGSENGSINGPLTAIRFDAGYKLWF